MQPLAGQRCPRHRRATPAPALVERIITSTATDLGAPADHQGAGLVNTLKAVQLAESIKSSSPQGSTLLASQTSLNATVNAGQPAGQPVTATVTVTNTGNIAKDYFADPRLNGKIPQALLGSDVTNVPLPLSLNAQPNWLVPTNTDAFVVAAQGTVPITMDTEWAFGDPDVAGVSFGNNSVAATVAPEVAPGFFFAPPEATGPFTTGTTGTVNLSAVADTNPFDSAVSSTSGDAWAQSVNASASYSPMTLNPGQSGTITLTITRTRPRER